MSALASHHLQQHLEVTTDDTHVIARLMSKCSEQAQELGKLHEQLLESQAYIEKLETDFKQQQQQLLQVGSSISIGSGHTNRDSNSEAAIKKRMERDYKAKVDALTRQLEVLEQRQIESNKFKSKLAHELDLKIRDNKLLEKKVQDLTDEKHQLRAQVESMARVTEQRGNSRTTHSVHHNVKFAHPSSTAFEINRLKGEAEKYQKLYTRAQDQLNDHVAKVKVLEDALEFRVDEIGLSGHADLLSKVSKLRGQITALTNEVFEKRQRLTEVEQSKTAIITEKEELRRQIMKIQDRLAASEEDKARLRNGEDVLAQLKGLEQERDILLEFIQGDMEKSVVLAKQLEDSTVELKALQHAHETTERKLAHSESQLANESQRAMAARLENQQLQAKVMELERMSDLLTHEKHHYTTRFEKKELEAEELSKMQLQVVMQLQERDSRLQNLANDLRDARDALHDSQRDVPRLQAEAEQLKEMLLRRDEELSQAYKQVHSIEPRVQQLEPEVKRLRSEKEQWLRDREALQSELEVVRPVGSALNELLKELASVTFPALDVNPSSPSKLTASGSKKDQHHYTSYSQKHALWTGLPAIRHLCPPLYEKVRSLSQDLHRKEIECSELQTVIPSLKREIELIRREYDEDMLRMTQQHEQTHKTMEDYRNQLMLADEEVVKLRSIRTTVDQIKLSLKAYPKGAVSISSNSANSSPSKLHDSSCGTGSNSNTSNQIFDLSQVPDHMLPEAIGRALMHNANAVINLLEMKSNYDQLHSGYQSIEKEYLGVKSELARQRQANDDLRNEAMRLEDVSRSTIHDLQRELDSATELAEKQNALTMTLESKIEALKKEKQLKAAQLTSAQQREESLRLKLLQSLEEYSRNYNVGGEVPRAAPSAQARLPDLVQHTCEVLAHLWRRATLQKQQLPSHSRDDDYMARSRTAQYRDLGTLHDSMGIFLHEDHSSGPSSGGGRLATNRAISYSPDTVPTSFTVQHRIAGTSASESASMPIHGSMSSSGSSGLQDSARGLHERLRKAQLSFASMKEPLEE